MLAQEISDFRIDRRLQHLLRARPQKFIQGTSLIELCAKRDNLRINGLWT